MIIKLLTEHLLEVLSLTGGCTCSSKSILVKMAHCWKSHAAAHILTARPPQTVLQHISLLQKGAVCLLWSTDQCLNIISNLKVCSLIL